MLSDRGISAIQGRNDPYTGEAFELRPEDKVELSASFFPQSAITGGLSKAGGLLAIAALKPPKGFSRWTDFFKKNPAQRGDYDTPVIQAKLPYPIRKSDKINTRFKIRLDI